MSSDERWRVERVAETGSTNADVAERFRAGEQPGLVLVAEHQTAGRGRLGRSWESPPGASLVLSVLLTPDAAPERWPWLPLVTGMAVAGAVGSAAGVAAALKWPNDVLVDGQKVCGILVERVEASTGSTDGRGPAAVIGIGVNVTQRREELPVPGATSLALASGVPVDRDDLLSTLLLELQRELEGWESGAEVRQRYLSQCVTIGQQVRVAVPGGEITGEATGVDEGGRLVVLTDDGEERLGAGDAVHVRPRE